MTSPIGSSASAIGLSGLRAAQLRLDVGAHNIANAQTPGFQRQQVVQTANPASGGVTARVERDTLAAAEGGDLGHLAEDLVGGKMALYSFAASLQVVKTEQDMLGTLFDQRA
ncbi:flagellar basal body protein [Hydrogenophaga pseudoflava]|uniref:flagellar basal body protein n=1 Tax=Hydrogenophaga pseudoflava TaxID=47421 RepID=UPI0027E49F23|nr:flagellar basal body protein [Hydrogenophaga pseudoflava]MDQ7746045.1 flagellar basal body protein [Hydrogenophaga pseudoflava]